MVAPLEMYNKTIIRFGFCDMPNYQCLGKSYQPRLRLADNFYLDIDTSAYHKNLIQYNCLVNVTRAITRHLTREFLK